MEISIGMSPDTVRVLAMVVVTIAVVACLIRYMDSFWE